MDYSTINAAIAEMQAAAQYKLIEQTITLSDGTVTESFFAFFCFSGILIALPNSGAAAFGLTAEGLARRVAPSLKTLSGDSFFKTALGSDYPVVVRTVSTPWEAQIAFVPFDPAAANIMVPSESDIDGIGFKQLMWATDPTISLTDTTMEGALTQLDSQCVLSLAHTGFLGQILLTSAIFSKTSALVSAEAAERLAFAAELAATSGDEELAAQLALALETIGILTTQVNALRLQTGIAAASGGLMTKITLVTPMLRAFPNHNGFAWIQSPYCIVAIPAQPGATEAPAIPVEDIIDVEPAELDGWWVWSMVPGHTSAQLLALGKDAVASTWLFPTGEETPSIIPGTVSFLTMEELEALCPNRAERIEAMLHASTIGAPTLILEALARTGPFTPLGYMGIQPNIASIDAGEPFATFLAGKLFELVVTPAAIFVREFVIDGAYKATVHVSPAILAMWTAFADARNLVLTTMTDGTLRIGAHNLPATGGAFSWDDVCDGTDFAVIGGDPLFNDPAALWACVSDRLTYAVTVFQGLTEGIVWSMMRTVWWPSTCPNVIPRQRNDAQMLIAGVAVGAVVGHATRPSAHQSRTWED